MISKQRTVTLVLVLAGLTFGCGQQVPEEETPMTEEPVVTEEPTAPGEASAAEAELPAGIDMEQLAVGPWRLISFEDDAEELPEFEITAEFEPTGRVAGKGGCNNYFTQIGVGDGGGMSLGPVGATRMACPPPFMDLETRYFAILEQVGGLAVDGDQLDFLDAEGHRLARFRRQE